MEFSSGLVSSKLPSRGEFDLGCLYISSIHFCLRCRLVVVIFVMSVAVRVRENEYSKVLM